VVDVYIGPLIDAVYPLLVEVVQAQRGSANTVPTFD